MNLYHLRYFLKLSELEHYTKAAESLNITQPSLSHAITSLETELGVKLFEKNGRNIQLTQNGHIYAQHIEEALDRIDKANQEMELLSKGAGHIRIGLLRTLSQRIIPSFTRSFINHHQNKEISFDFQTDTGMSKDIIDSLHRRKIDIAFCSKVENTPKVTYVPVAEQEFVLIVPQNHELTRRKNLKLVHTLDYPQIWFSEKSGLRPAIEHIFKPTKGSPTIDYEVEEDETVAGLVSEGFGIAIIPNLPILNLLDVEIIHLSDLKSKRIFYMAYLTDAYRNPVIQDFIDYIKELPLM